MANGSTTGPLTCNSGYACATSPLQVGTDTKWVAIAAGANHNMAVKSDGTLWGWGDNTWGQVGVSSPATVTTPTQIPQVATGTYWTDVFAAANHTIAVRNDGTLYVWGYNNYGQLGDGTIIVKELTPADHELPQHRPDRDRLRHRRPEHDLRHRLLLGEL